MSKLIALLETIVLSDGKQGRCANGDMLAHDIRLIEEENAKLREQLAAARNAALSEGIRAGEILKRAEVAEAKLKALERKLAEQQANITQVRILCAGEAHPRWDNSFQTTTTRGRILDLTEGGSEELSTLLAKAREEGFAAGSANAGFAHALDCNKAFNDGMEKGMREAVPEGWQVVPKEPTEVMLDSVNEHIPSMSVWAKMLAAAPTPKEKPWAHARNT